MRQRDLYLRTQKKMEILYASVPVVFKFSRYHTLFVLFLFIADNKYQTTTDVIFNYFIFIYFTT